MIAWSEDYATGIARIDDQHKWLFNFVNTLEKKLDNEEDSVDVGHILDRLEKYAQRHFEYEESCMARWRCPFAQENKCAHKNFIDAYENFMERYDREGHSAELAWRIQDVCEKWLIDHICQIDLKLRKVSIPERDKATEKRIS